MCGTHGLRNDGAKVWSVDIDSLCPRRVAAVTSEVLRAGLLMWSWIPWSVQGKHGFQIRVQGKGPCLGLWRIALDLAFGLA